MKTVLITGGSHGIGLELAKCFAQDGYRIVLAAKPPEELAKAEQILRTSFPKAEICTHALDLSNSGAGQALHDWINLRGYKVDVLVNNAGFGNFGFFNEINSELDHKMFRLNMHTIYDLTRLFAQDMIERDEGKIVNVSSTAALVPAPLLSAYSATKAFVYQLTVGYDYELRRSGSRVRIMVLCPPPTRTGFGDAAGMGKTKLFSGFWCLDASDVAQSGYRALLLGKRRIIPGGLRSLLFQILAALLPLSVKLRMAYNNIRKHD